MLRLRKLSVNLKREFGGLGAIFRSTVLLSGVQVIAKAIGFISLPILSRLYAPADFGIYATYMAAVGILVMVGSIRIEFIIPIMKTRRHASYILILSMIVSFFTMTIVFFILILINKIFSLKIPMSFSVITLASGVVMLWFNAVSTFSVRIKDYNHIGISQIIRYLSQVFFQIIFGFLGFFQFGLIIGDAIGRIFSIFILIPRAFAEIRLRYFRHFRVMLRAVKPFLRHCVTHTVTSILHALPTLMLPVFILHTYSSTDAGYFSFSYQIVLSAAQIVMLSLAKVYIGEISDVIRRNPQSIRRTTSRIIFVLAAMSVMPGGIVGFFAPQIYTFVFGESWLDSAFYFRIMLPAIIVQIVIGPVFNLIILLRQAHRQLRCDLAVFFAVVLLMGAASQGMIGLNGLLAGFSAAITIGYLWLLVELYASIAVFERSNESQLGTGGARP